MEAEPSGRQASTDLLVGKPRMGQHHLLRPREQPYVLGMTGLQGCPQPQGKRTRPASLWELHSRQGCRHRTTALRQKDRRQAAAAPPATSNPRSSSPTDDDSVWHTRDNSGCCVPTRCASSPRHRHRSTLNAQAANSSRNGRRRTICEIEHTTEFRRSVVAATRAETLSRASTQLGTLEPCSRTQTPRTE